MQNKHSSAISLQTGATIGKYELIEKIGSGAMSVVYKARDIALNRTVAIKFLLIDALDGAEFLKRFKQEAKALGTLEHQNIVKVHEIATTESGAPYIVMSYLNGINLAGLLANEGKLSQDR
ncbi:MAG: protein kinase [Cyanobacteria bacterium SZAS-4]|nr:protein kinase [Cyanobacteria bacterium SZAS-4]